MKTGNRNPYTLKMYLLSKSTPMFAAYQHAMTTALRAECAGATMTSVYEVVVDDPPRERTPIPRPTARAPLRTHTIRFDRVPHPIVRVPTIHRRSSSRLVVVSSTSSALPLAREGEAGEGGCGR